MMIHEKIMSGQFLLDIKNEHSSLLRHHGSPSLHHHMPHHTQHMLPMAAANAPKLDLYSAYAYQQQLQQQLLIGGPAAAAAAAAMQQQQQQSHHHQQQQQHHQSNAFAVQQTAEVLDLSRRCDSVETPRKTPSPYQTTSSFGGSPATSPTSQPQQQQSQIPVNLLYSAQAQQHLPAGLASLYPGLYYGGAVKQEQPASVSPTQSPQQQQPQTLLAPVQAVQPNATASLLQTFASAAAVAAATLNGNADSPMTEAPKSPKIHNSIPVATTPTSSTTTAASACSSSALASMDSKNTRPFKAFPRDPLVIAANFAATDVLLDNPRVERYTEYRKRVLEQIRSSNGGSRTVTNPKMRRTNSRSTSINDGSSCSNNNSENEDRNGAEESSDCDSNAGNFDKIMTTSSSSTSSMEGNNNATGSNNISASQMKDAAYYERRRKNNAAAKKSRDRRRIKEDEIAIRAAYLERQNIELLCQIDALKAQLSAFTSKVGA